MSAALKPKAVVDKHPEAFYHGLRLCGVDGSLFSATNTPKSKRSCARPGVGGAGRLFPRWERR